MRLDEFLESDNVESAPAGDFDSLVASIRHVESGGNSRAVSPQGASGSMQIMPATFRQYAIDGESYDNDSHRTNAAIRKLEDDYAYYDGDLSKTAAAYIGGRGAVRKDGSIRDDVKDAHGTSPMAYANRVLGRMGQGGRSDYSSKQEDDAPADEFAEFDKFLSGRTLGAVESAMQQEPSTASKNSDGAFSRGVSGTKSSAAQTYALATGDFEGAAKTLAEQQAYRQRNPESPEEKKFMDDYRGANGVIESLGAVVKNPVGFAKANIAQIPNMVAPMAGMIGLGAAGSTAGPVGTVAGGFTGATLGNALVEGGQKIEQALNEAGINPNDTASVTAFLRENQGDILTKTGIKAGVIGAVDTATMGIASAWLKAPARAAMQANERLLTGMGVNVADKVAVQSAMRSPVYIAGREAIDGAYKAATSGATNFARHAGVAAMGPGGEFSGEYFGEGFSTGDYNASEAGLEALMASGTSAATFAGQKAYAVATNPFKTDGTQPAAPPAPTPATILAQPDVDSAIAAASAVTAAPVNQDALLAELDSGLNLATLEPELLETVNDAAPLDAPSNLGTGIDGSGSAGNPSVVPSIETGRGGDATAPLPDSGTVAPVGDAGTALGDVTQHTIVAPDIRSAIQAAHNQFGESATIVSQQITEGGVSLTVSVPAATAGDVAPLRPQTIAGRPAASYTDAELQTTATSPLIHMDTRKSAMLELQARSMGQMDQDILALEAQNAPFNEPEQTNEASQAPLQQSPAAAVQPGRLVGADANRVPVVLDNREAVSALGLGYTRLDALPERVGDSPEVTSARRQEVAQLEQLVGLTGAKLHLVSHESGTPQFGGAYIPELPGHIFVDVNNNGAVKQALRVVIAHESMHDLEARNPKLYQSLVAAVQQHTTKISKQEFEALYGQTLPSDSRVTSEQMANLLGNVLYKPENVERLLMDAYGPDVDGAAGFIATIRKVLRSLMDKLGGNFDARSYKGNFDEVEKILMEGYGAFIKASGRQGLSAKLSLQQAESRMQQSPVESVSEHKMQITREDRELADKTKLTRDELGKVKTYAQLFALPPKLVETEVRRIKSRFPEASGWAPLEFLRVDPKTMKKKAKPDNPLPADAIFFAPYSYQFHLDGQGKDDKKTRSKRVATLASALSGEIVGKYLAAQRGDPVATVIMRQSDWYQSLRGKLRASFGGFGDFLAQLLGPTSANNPVEPNFKYGVEALKLATSGKWDNLFKEVFAWKADVDAASSTLDSVIEEVRAEGKKGVMADPRVTAAVADLKAAGQYKGTMPLRENGKQFGMASAGIQQILADTWGDKVRGDAPKTKNYYQNIVGRTFDATIDVWAARTLRRLANDLVGSFPHIPTVAETAVGGNVLVDNVTSGAEFGFGQDVFRQAAAELRGSGIEKFRSTTPDAVQAMIWFAEKELWARRDWTTKIGEEGSIEHELGSAGFADRKQVDAWRVAARAGRPNPATKAFQGKDGQLRQDKFEKAVAKWKDAKAIAAAELSKIERYPDRFVAGVTTEIPGEKPTNAEQANAAREIEAAAADPKVMAARAQSSTGEFMGDLERTLDVEIVARNGYDATPLWNKLVEIGDREGQQAVFLSRVLREDELGSIDPMLHRPGVELYFAKPKTMAEVQPLIDLINEAGVHGMTMATEGRRSPDALSGKDQPIAGIRMQHIPEFMFGYGYDVSSTDADISASILAARDTMRKLVETLQANADVATATAHWYETRVHFYGNENAKHEVSAGSGSGKVDQGVWSGQRISEALEGAARFDGYGKEPLAARRDQLRADRQVSRGDTAQRSPVEQRRSDAPGNGWDGSSNAQASSTLEQAGYGRASPGAVTVQGTHFSSGERSNLDGRYYGTGARGDEAARVRAATDPRIKERVYFYVNKGNGVTPEQGVGSIAHAAQLNNVYDANADTWVQAKVAKAADDATWFSNFESAVIDNGFDGYVTDFGTQRAAVLLGRHNVPVTRGQGGSSQVKERPTDPLAARRDLPMGKMSGADWKRMLPEMDLAHLEDGKSYYKDGLAAVQYSPVRQAPNGKPSNLDEKQYAQVRTPEFKAWFGDWEHAAANGGVWSTDKVSKVVDENGEPLVVYHGAENGGFTKLDPAKGDKHRSPMIFAARTANTARSYSGRGDEIDLNTGMYDRSDDDYDEQRGIYSLFLNIRNPNEDHMEGANWDGSRFDDQWRVLDENGDTYYTTDGKGYFTRDDADTIVEGNPGYELQQEPEMYRTTNSIAEEALKYGNDGAIIRQVVDDGGRGGIVDADDIFVIFDSNQAKSATQNTGAFSAKNDDLRYSPLAQVWADVAKDEDAFQFPTSEQTDFVALMAEIDPALRVSEKGVFDDKTAKRFVVTMPDNKSADVFVGKNKEMWVNASQLKVGKSSGVALYAGMLNYAHNNGYVLKGDPLGVSTMATFRRTENMISSALKFGTTRHMRPSDTQRSPQSFKDRIGYSDGVINQFAPMAWEEGNDLANIDSMLRVSYANIQSLLPEIENARYNFTNGTFEWAGTDRPIAESEWTDLSERLHGALLAGRAASSELGGRRVATASPGEAPRSATVKRAAVTATVLREPGGALGGVLLGREGGELPVGLAAGRPFAGRERALKGVLYSPANAVSDQSPTDRTLDADRLTELRRAAARLERPRDAVFLRVTDTGHVIATGPKGTRVPETFTRFARDQGLSFEARRNGGNNGLASNSAPMPEAYRESGARYFGEGNISFDRTGKTRFSPVTQTSGRFYSQLSRAFEQAPDKVFGKAPQVALWLKSNAGKLGVKQDEIQWTGISDWLALQDKVSKADVLGYLAQNGVQVEEVEKGAKPGEPTVSFEDGKWVVRGGSGKVFGRYSSEEDANTARPRAFEYSLVPTKYSQYVLPGGENYRELLLTLPEKHTYPKTPVLTRAQQNAMALLNNKMRKDGNLPASEMAEWRAYRDQERAYAAELEQLKAAGKNKEPFRSSHWEEDNILAHVRFNDRTDAEGSKVLFIEELQSDWGQGFKKFKDKNTDDLEIALRQVDKQPIPAAPFVTDTKSWLSLGIKRMIAYAAENGYDKVAFVNGEQSADRYDLSKTIRRLEYKPDSKELTAFDHNGRAVLDERVEPENIEDYIGKDPAKRLLESEPVTTGAGKKVHSIEGDGLKIGGEGMKTFYDKIVPQTINDVLKKLGGGKVERVSLPLGKETWNGADTGRVTIGNEFVSQNGFTITPELRASVQGGMPLFAPVNQATTPAWATEVTGKVDSFIYEIQDKFIDLKRVRDAIKEAGIQVREEYDAYVAEELNHGRAAYRVQLFLEQEFDPLLAEMKMRGVTAEEFDKYLHARHAPERNAAMAKANPNQAELDQSILDAEDDVHTAELDLQMANGAQAELWALQKAQSKLAALQVTKPFSGTEEQRQMLSGMSNAEAALVIAAGRPTMAALGQKVDDIVASTRTLLSGYGLETQETVAAMAKAYKHYVPLMREMDESDLLGTGGNGTGAGYSIKGSTLKRATGSLRKVESILANLMAQREQAIVRGEKALVGKSLYGMALSAPNPEFWSVIRPNMSAKAMKAAMLDANMDPALIKAMVDAPLEAYIDPNTGMVRFRANPMIGREPNAIVVRVAGQDRVILFNAQNDRAVRLADALKNADSVHFKGWLKSADGGLGQTTRYISAVNTQYNPIFGIKNFVRDFQGAGFNLSTTQIKGQEAKALGHVGSAIRAIYRQERGKSVTRQAWADAWQEFRESGAEIGYMDAFNGIEDRVSSIQKHIKGHNLLVGGVMPILNWLGDYNTAIENGVRLSAYKAARESGMSKIAAASMAKNLTVNFNRKGRTGGKLSGWFAFFNAAVQGNARIIETFRGGRKGKAAAMFASKLAISGMTIGATLALIGIALMGDDWDDIPEFVRERDIIIPLGKVALEGANIGKTKEGWSYLHIPMALGFHLLPATGRTMVELAMLKGDEGKRMTDLLSAWVGGMNPMGSINIGDKGWGAVGEMVAPSVVDPFLQLGNNQNAFGRPIAKQNRSELDPTPAPDRFFKSASSFGKAASKGLDRVSGGDGAEPGYVQFTPDQIDFIFGQITGGVGRESLKAYQYLESKVTGDSIPESRVPIKGMFYGETKSEQSVTGKFYELERKVHIAERGIKLHPTDEGKEKYTKSHPEVQLSSSMKASLRDLTRLQKYRKRADADGDKAEVKRLDGESTAARLRVLDAYDELER